MVMVSAGWERGKSRRFWLAPHAPRTFVHELAHRACVVGAFVSFLGLVRLRADPLFQYDVVVIAVLGMAAGVVWIAVMWNFARMIWRRVTR